MSEQTERRYRDALNRLAKWRGHFAGWQLGSRLSADPEFQAVRDHRELTILLRAEVTALTGLLLKKGIVTEEDLHRAVADEAELLSQDYSRRWPGARATDEGMTYDLEQARPWMEKWLP